MEISIYKKGKSYDLDMKVFFEEDKKDKFISNFVKTKQFEAKKGQIFETFTKNKNCLLIGAGKKEEFSSQVMRLIVSKALRYANEKKYWNLLLDFRDETYLRAVVETAYECLHPSDILKTKEKSKVEVKKLDLKIKDSKENKSILKKSKIIASSVNWAKDLINLPANIANPKFVVNEAKKIKNIKITVFDRKRIKKEKLNLVEAVTRSSKEEPQFMIVEYKPTKTRNKKPYCLVGKGITYDTGGLSLKPANYMRDMKTDMAGAASVLATVKALSEMGAPYYVIAITPLCENAIGGDSYRVDDVIKAYNGLNVEINNTDAEGRLVLADALSYSSKFKPEFVVDIATLTGAAGIALGDRGACYMSNDDDLASNLEIASLHTDDKIWRFPLWDEYNELLKSKIADVMNVTENRGPGVIIGGLFLQNFVKGKWAHIDIGMSAFNTKKLPNSNEGATGLGVKLLIDFVENYE